MSDRIMARGVIAEKRRRIHDLETEIEGLCLVIRNAIAPFLDIDMLRPALALQSAKRLHQVYEERATLAADLKKLEAEWGEA